jgi:hypothetical protein
MYTGTFSRTILIISLTTIFDNAAQGFGFTTYSRQRETRTFKRTSLTGKYRLKSFTNIVTSRRSSLNDKEPSKGTSARTCADVESSLEEGILVKFNQYHSDADTTYTESNLLRFTMEEFKPLGCTAEESLNVESDGSKHVFISKVVDGGNAQNAGLQAGDVIVGVSGSFDAADVTPVGGASLEKVKLLFAARGEGDGCVLVVVRGSNVMSKHETTLVDLCVLPDNGNDVDKCIESMYKADYDIETVDSATSDEGNCDDGDMDCMLDAMFDVWADEVGIKKDEEVKEIKEVKKKPAPWSSRSSPSGTYVRDPKTGKMVNIDE